MLANPLLPSFLDTYSLSTSSLGCKILCIASNFLVFRSICSSLVHFNNDPDYFTRETIKVFIPLRKYLLRSFVSRNFLVRLFLFFFLSSLFYCAHFQYFKVDVILLFSKVSSSILIWPISSLCYLSFYHFSLCEWHILSMPNSIPINCLYILIVSISIQFFFLFLQAAWCRQCTFGDQYFLAILLICSPHCTS